MYFKIAKRENLECSQHKRKKYIFEVMDYLDLITSYCITRVKIPHSKKVKREPTKREKSLHSAPQIELNLQYI